MHRQLRRHVIMASFVPLQEASHCRGNSEMCVIEAVISIIIMQKCWLDWKIWAKDFYITVQQHINWQHFLGNKFLLSVLI